MILRTCGLSVLLVLLSANCPPVSYAQVVEREGESHIAFIEDDNIAMNAAIDAARASLPHFWEQFANAAAIDEMHLLKVGLPTPEGDSEFIWIYPTDYDAESEEFQGMLMNEPFNLAGNLKIGDLVNFQDEQIIDWSYYEGEMRRGEFTTRVLIANMSSEEAEAYEGMLHSSPIP
jgi:uncharacterized protein YegJ (DUF2314 family)